MRQLSYVFDWGWGKQPNDAYTPGVSQQLDHTSTASLDASSRRSRSSSIVTLIVRSSADIDYQTMNRWVSLVRYSLVPLGPAHACPADTYVHCFWHSKGCIPAGGHLCSEPTGRRVSSGVWHESATRFPGLVIGTRGVWERHELLCSGNGRWGGPYRGAADSLMAHSLRILPFLRALGMYAESRGESRGWGPS